MATGCELVLSNVLLPGGRVADLSLAGGRVCHVGAGLATTAVIDCRGMTVLPAAVDMHVHMRGRIQSHKEDWGSGSRSALAGGVTVVVDQPNTIPPLTTCESFIRRVNEAREASLCHFAINAGYTPGSDLPALWGAGAMAFGELFAAPSSYGECLQPGDLCAALETVGSLGGLCTIHAEEVGSMPDRDLPSHHAARSPRGECRAVRWVRELNTHACRLHFCHMSSAESVLNAGDSTVEVTPHHLFTSLEEFDPSDARGKVNPPLRPDAVRRDLLSVWDRIDVLASDHAPHTPAEKDQSFESAPSGIPGVETMVPLALAFCRERKIPITSLMEKTSWRPAEILGIPRAGFFVGDRADFAVYPGEDVVIRAEMLHSRASWTPFEGKRAVFPGTVIMGGRVVCREGTFFPGDPSWFPGRGFIGPAPIKNGADTAQP
jgi:dihydroorotase